MNCANPGLLGPLAPYGADGDQKLYGGLGAVVENCAISPQPTPLEAMTPVNKPVLVVNIAVFDPSETITLFTGHTAGSDQEAQVCACATTGVAAATHTAAPRRERNVLFIGEKTGR